MIFYSISNKHSTFYQIKKFYERIRNAGVSGGFDFDTGETSYSIAQH